VQDVENRAEERRQKRTMSEDDDEENVVIEEDFLFNSVWISIPVNEEKGALSKKINHDVDDLVSETGSYATTTASRSTARQRTPKSKRRKLKLERSRHHKITFELRGVAADIVVFPPESGETLSSVNLRVHDFEIFDHVPTSTWKKFATSLLDPTQREMGRSMINLELLTVKPVRDLAASELVLKVSMS
jgi:autophagy-related protein 2